MPADEYHLVSRGSLKLKGSAGKSETKSKKKSSKKRAKRLMKEVRTGGDSEARMLELEKSAAEAAALASAQRTRTKAEVAFERQRDTTDAKRILKKASETHKQRVEKFNRQLDSLSDHYDIPKVSWTK